MTTAFQANAFQVGAFQIAVDAAVQGSIITVPLSLFAGGSSGSATAPGSLVERGTQRALIPGSATGTEAGDAIAQGATLEIVASLLPGVATATSQIAIVSGGGHFVERRKDAQANGAVIRCRATLAAGRASTVSLLAGQASGHANAANDNLDIAVQLIPGTATGQRSYSDDELFVIFAEAA